MCVIIHLMPNQMPNYEHLENAVYNNWHSYGLVTKVANKLDIKRHVPTNGEVDPKAVWKALEDDIEYERYLHLRHNTAGATNEENCHPFDIYYNPKTGRQLVWMHNGTFFNYKSKKKNEHNVEVDDDDGPSDTKNFTDWVLIPYLSCTNFGDGAGDITHHLSRRLIMKFWGGSNRGVIIANDQNSFFIDDWKWIEDDDEGKYLASNDTYFKDVSRGPEHDRRKLRREQLEAVSKAQGKKASKTRDIQRYDEYRDASREEHPFFELSKSLAKVISDWPEFDRENATKLGFATPDELIELYDERDDCLAVMDWVFTDYAKMYQDLTELIEKHKKASNIIAGLVEQNRKNAA